MGARARQLQPAIEKEASLYDGEVTLQLGDFDGRHHAYYWVEKGYFVPGATSILSILDKPALMPWAAKVATEYVLANYREGMSKAEMKALCQKAKGEHTRRKETAGDYGAQVHDACEALLHGKPVEVSNIPEVQRGISAFQEWLGHYEVKPIDTECLVLSRIAFYAGKFDLLASVGGKLTLVDFKTSSGVYKEHKLQLGGYRYAWEEEHNEPIEQLIVLHLDKQTGAMTPYVYDDPQETQFFVDTFLRTKALTENIRKMGDY